MFAKEQFEKDFEEIYFNDKLIVLNNFIREEECCHLGTIGDFKKLILFKEDQFTYYFVTALSKMQTDEIQSTTNRILEDYKNNPQFTPLTTKNPDSVEFDDQNQKSEIYQDFINYCKLSLEYIEKNNQTMMINKFEIFNNHVYELLQFLLNQFYCNLEYYGVWPVRPVHTSGCIQAYYHPSKDADKHLPCAKTWSNFFLGVDESFKIIVYKNRCSALCDHSFPEDWDVRDYQVFFDKLEIEQEITVNKGDIVYIPAHQYYSIEPLGEALFFNIPLILKGPYATHGIQEKP